MPPSMPLQLRASITKVFDCVERYHNENHEDLLHLNKKVDEEIATQITGAHHLIQLPSAATCTWFSLTATPLFALSLFTDNNADVLKRLVDLKEEMTKDIDGKVEELKIGCVACTHCVAPYLRSASLFPT